mmetsp:Transcript_21092/g.46437  ORF Transcript_21092/g.46437 Transcript_21092/m.46437 type:complete len:203 (+) Transcript_21092:980-1588(+)
MERKPSWQNQWNPVRPMGTSSQSKRPATVRISLEEVAKMTMKVLRRKSAVKMMKFRRRTRKRKARQIALTWTATLKVARSALSRRKSQWKSKVAAILRTWRWKASSSPCHIWRRASSACVRTLFIAAFLPFFRTEAHFGREPRWTPSFRKSSTDADAWTRSSKPRWRHGKPESRCCRRKVSTRWVRPTTSLKLTVRWWTVAS